MAQKHLHELLKEDQEPFYNTNKRFQLKRLNFSSPKTSLIQIKKTQKPITQTSTSTFCKNTCFFSFNDSPDIRKSPLKSPQNGKVFLHVPTKTATLLLEAAMRIQKVQQTSKPKPQVKKVKFGVFGSILKKLKDRNSNKKGENSVRIISTSAEITRNAYEEKCMDLETYSRNNGDLDTCPLSPFRFSLQRCKSTGDVMPEFTSPVSHKREGKENDETISIDQLVEEADEKEQCSPVSVLDPPFEEDDDGHEGGDEDKDCDLEGGDEDEGEDCDLECSYALVQRAQQQLLHKLRRFEKLAELDPIELEKLFLDEEDNDAPADEEEYQVSNLISEEKSEVKNLNYGEAVFGKEVKRFDSSQESRSNTPDMMVKSYLQSEFDEWNNFQEQREETAIEFAFSIFGLLVEEFGEELIH